VRGAESCYRLLHQSGRIARHARCSLTDQARSWELKRQLLSPGDEVLGELHEPQPHLVVREAVEREVRQAAVLGLANAVLDTGVAAVVKVELGDALARLVAEEHREPGAVMVGEGCWARARGDEQDRAQRDKAITAER
jgi:hypothetical protein